MTDARPTTEEIVALETSYWEAMKAKDGKRTAELSADPSIGSGAQGFMRIPRAQMGAMTEEGEWTLESYEFEDVEVSTPTPDPSSPIR